MDEFCTKKGIKREFSNARTPQQNGVAERRNRTLIEAARTMLADAKLPVTFWAEAVSTACYVQNRVSSLFTSSKRSVMDRSDLDGNNTSIFEQGETSGSNMSRPMIKFVKESGCPNAIKINNTEITRKPTMKYAEMYKDTSKFPKVRGNQRNWNNLKSQQLGKDFLMQNKASAKNQIWEPKVPTGRTKIPTVGSNVPTAKPTGAADLGNKGKAVKASARWI
ncbi:ribonuclease H-like domain-containing protein [Tanacetum coccineum]